MIKSSIMALRGNTYLLALVSHTREPAIQSDTERGLPSWIPDCTVHNLHPLLAAELGGLFNTCDGLRRPFVLDDPGVSIRRTFVVRGMSVARISAVGPITSTIPRQTSRLVTLSDLLEEGINLVIASHIDRCVALDRLPALLTAGPPDRKAHEQATWTHSWASFRLLVEDIALETPEYRDLTNPPPPTLSLPAHIIDTCTNRRLCDTSTGVVGIGPWLLLEDDIMTS